jgi:transketolase
MPCKRQTRAILERRITIEENTALAYSDDVATRFIGYGWNVTRVGDANDLAMLERAFKTFSAMSDGRAVASAWRHSERRRR